MAIYPSKKKTPITSITPSNISPVSISAGTNYTPSESGKVVRSVQVVGPDDTNPPLLYRIDAPQNGPLYMVGSNQYTGGYLIATKNLSINYGIIAVPKASLPTNFYSRKTFEYQFESFPRSGVNRELFTKLTIKNFAIKEIPPYKIYVQYPVTVSAGEYIERPPIITITNYRVTGDPNRPFALSFEVLPADHEEYQSVGGTFIEEFLNDLTINCYYTDFSSF